MEQKSWQLTIIYPCRSASGPIVMALDSRPSQYSASRVHSSIAISLCRALSCHLLAWTWSTDCTMPLNDEKAPERWGTQGWVKHWLMIYWSPAIAVMLLYIYRYGIANTRLVKKTDSTINKCGSNISPYSLRLPPLGFPFVSILNPKLPYRNMPSVSIKFLNLWSSISIKLFWVRS